MRYLYRYCICCETYKKIEEFMKILEKEEKNTEKMRDDK